MPIDRTTRAVHNRETRWDRLSHLHRRITLIATNRFAAGERASTAALIRYYRVGRANVMKFGSPIGIRRAAERSSVAVRENVSRRRLAEKKENALETLVEPGGGSDGVALQTLCQSGLCCVPLLGLIEAPSVFSACTCLRHHDRLKSYLVLAFLRLRCELMKGILRLAHLDQVSLTWRSPVRMDRKRKFP